MLAERMAFVTLLVECAGDGGPEPRTLDKMADEAAIDFSPSFPFVASVRDLVRPSFRIPGNSGQLPKISGFPLGKIDGKKERAN